LSLLNSICLAGLLADVELTQIFSCFDVDMVLLEKYGILLGDDTEVIKAKIGQYFEKKHSTQSIINTNYIHSFVLVYYILNYMFSFDSSCIFADRLSLFSKFICAIIYDLSAIF